MQTEETIITPAQRSPAHSHSLPRLPSPLPLAIALTEGDTPLSFPAPSVPPTTPMVSTTLTVVGLSTGNILSPANRLSPDVEEELRTQVQKLKDLNKKERVNKLKQELARLRLAQASTSPPPYIPTPIASTSGTQRSLLVAPESSQASSSSEGDSTSDVESDYSGGSCSRASSHSPYRERAKERSSYTRFHHRTPPRDSVRGRPASPYESSSRGVAETGSSSSSPLSYLPLCRRSPPSSTNYPYTSVGGIWGLTDSRSTITPTAASCWRGSRTSDSLGTISRGRLPRGNLLLASGGSLAPRRDRGFSHGGLG